MPGICAVSPPIKRATGRATGLGKTAQELIEDPRLEFFRADVIEKEERPRAEDGDVVDAMVHEIGADGVVPVQREGDLQFRADAVDARDQHRLAHPGKIRRERGRRIRRFFPSTSGTVRLPDAGLNSALERIAEVDIDAGAA